MKFSRILLIFFAWQSAHPVTFVYNLKIAETTRHQSINGSTKKHVSIAALTMIRQYRKRKNGSEQDVGGGLATFIHAHPKWFLEIDTALGNVKEACRSRTQLDDILLTFGYKPTIRSENKKITISGILGIPTHRDRVLQPIQFGVGSWSLGAQFDASWNYSLETRRTLLGAFRFLRFFSRDIHIILGPINSEFDFRIGNLVDILIGHMHIWDRQKFEVGYNGTFGFGSDLSPALDVLEDQTNFIRQGFYGTYRYGTLIKNEYPAALAFGLSYSFDTRPDVVGFARIVSMWVTAGISF